MDKWIGDNPKATAYIIYLSVVVVLLSLISLYYFRKAHAASSDLIKVKSAQTKTKKAPLPAHADKEVQEKDGFTIIDGDD
jgi:hypothetical protein